MDKVVVQPYIQRVEQHKTDREVAPKTETKVQNVDKVEVVPYIQREEKHTTQRQVLPQTKDETKKIVKKVIQPIIKDVIQPIHIRIKPELQEGIKPTIFKKEEVRPVINQGTKTAQTIVKETKVEKEVNAGVKVRESIVRSSVLPTDNKGVIVKKEIISTNAVGLGGAAGGAGLGLEGVQFSQAINAEGVHKEVVTGTTVRQSIVRSSVLPTIDGGVKVLKPIFGGVRQSTAAGAGIGVGAGFEGEASAQYGAGLGAASGSITQHQAIDLGTTVHNTIDLGVVNKGTVDLGVVNKGVVDLGVVNKGVVDLGVVNTGSSNIISGSGIGQSGLIMGQTEGNAFTTSQMANTQGLGTSGLMIGNEGNANSQINVEGLGNNSVSQFVTTGPKTVTNTTRTVNYTTTTGQPIVGTSNVLNPIVKTTVNQPIVTGSMMNVQTNPSNI